MLRLNGTRGAAVVLALVCCAVLGYAAVAANGAGTPLTEKQVSAVEAEMHSAVQSEDTALSEMSKQTGAASDAAATALHHSEKALASAETMLRGHDLGGFDPVTDIGKAIDDDHLALALPYYENKTVRARAEKEIEKAVPEKRAVLGMLLKVPTETQTGSTESLKGCAFEGNHNATSWTIDVKVSDPGEAGASGTVTIAGLVTPPLTGTFKLSSTGTAISQFTVTNIGDASITIDLSSLTTPGQTLMLPFTFPLTTSTLPATDCSPQ